MLSEEHVILHSNHVVLIMFIVLIKIEQDLQLHSRLILELLLVSDYFDGHDLAVRVVYALESLSETARPERFQHFKPVPNVVLQHRLVIAVAVIITIIVDIH